MSFCGLKGICDATGLENDSNIRVLSLFDNEEVGSVSVAGADSNMLEVTLKRLGTVEFVGDSKKSGESMV